MCYTEELRKFFDNQGITQKAIAQRMNVDPAYINKLLNGKRPLEGIRRSSFKTFMVYLLHGS